MLYFIQINCLEWFLKIIRETIQKYIIAILKLYSVLGTGKCIFTLFIANRFCIYQFKSCGSFFISLNVKFFSL